MNLINKKAIVLSSGGVDSTTCVSIAVKELGAENVVTASIFYGQKHEKEILAARKVAEYYHVRHYEFDLSAIFQYSNCSLLKGSTEEIIHESYAEQIAKNGEGKVSTYVPFRNGLMLSTAASLAASLFEEDEVDIYIGAHLLLYGSVSLCAPATSSLFVTVYISVLQCRVFYTIFTKSICSIYARSARPARLFFSFVAAPG